MHGLCGLWLSGLTTSTCAYLLLPPSSLASGLYTYSLVVNSVCQPHAYRHCWIVGSRGVAVCPAVCGSVRCLARDRYALQLVLACWQWRRSWRAPGPLLLLLLALRFPEVQAEGGEHLHPCNCGDG